MSDAYVLTPGGYKPRDQVHHLPEGQVFKLSDGFAELHHPEFGLAKALGKQPKPTDARPLLPRSVQALPPGVLAPFYRGFEALDADTFPQVNGWVSYVGWNAPAATPITRFATTWTVPAEPANRGGQTIFLFNGIQNSSMILQPVLQWGPSAAGGGPRWSIACWYADSQTGHSVYSTLVDVAVGAELTGVMTMTGQSGPGFDYLAEFEGLPDTRLPIVGQPMLTWANETLEAYGISRLEDLPASAATDFSAIDLQTGHAPAPLAWDVQNDHPETNCRAVVVDGGSEGGHVRISYA